QAESQRGPVIDLSIMNVPNDSNAGFESTARFVVDVNLDPGENSLWPARPRQYIGDRTAAPSRPLAGRVLLPRGRSARGSLQKKRDYLARSGVEVRRSSRGAFCACPFDGKSCEVLDSTKLAVSSEEAEKLRGFLPCDRCRAAEAATHGLRLGKHE